MPQLYAVAVYGLHRAVGNAHLHGGVGDFGKGVDRRESDQSELGGADRRRLAHEGEVHSAHPRGIRQLLARRERERNVRVAGPVVGRCAHIIFALHTALARKKPPVAAATSNPGERAQFGCSACDRYADLARTSQRQRQNPQKAVITPRYDRANMSVRASAARAGAGDRDDRLARSARARALAPRSTVVGRVVQIVHTCSPCRNFRAAMPVAVLAAAKQRTDGPLAGKGRGQKRASELQIRRVDPWRSSGRDSGDSGMLDK